MRLGLFFLRSASRASVFIDGFNLYHAIDELGLPQLKAVAKWSFSKANKHKTYIKALKRRGVVSIEGNFKKGNYKCHATCREKFQRHEEKKTDVNVALAIALGAVQNNFDVGIIVSNDSDFVPAIKVATDYGKQIVIVTPPGKRTQDELNTCASSVHRLDANQLGRALLPDPVAGIAKGDKQIKCPQPWK